MKKFPALTERLIDFIHNQKIFFVGTATDTSRVSVSPKGMDSLRVLSDNRVIWLNVTGSGNETAIHMQSHPRMTIMFCAFEGAPMILRLYGTARAIHPGDVAWAGLISQFDALPGARQIFDLSIDLVQTSCGMSVPFLDYQNEREQLNDWAIKKGQAGIEDYWQSENQQSIDGIQNKNRP